MTIEQTIDIPENHRVTFDLPFSFPVGKVKVAISVYEKTEESMLLAIEKLSGMYNKTGDTVDAFLERKHADKALEYAIEERRRKEGEQFRQEKNKS
jgi:hypothetical protein